MRCILKYNEKLLIGIKIQTLDENVYYNLINLCLKKK